MKLEVPKRCRSTVKNTLQGKLPSTNYKFKLPVDRKDRTSPPAARSTEVDEGKQCDRQHHTCHTTESARNGEVKEANKSCAKSILGLYCEVTPGVKLDLHNVVLDHLNESY